MDSTESYFSIHYRITLACQMEFCYFKESICIAMMATYFVCIIDDIWLFPGYTDAKNKQRFNPAWAETDLDNEEPEHGSCSPTRSMAPLYIDIHSEQQQQRAPSPDQSDDLGLNSAFGELKYTSKGVHISW